MIDVGKCMYAWKSEKLEYMNYTRDVREGNVCIFFLSRRLRRLYSHTGAATKIRAATNRREIYGNYTNFSNARSCGVVKNYRLACDAGKLRLDD